MECQVCSYKNIYENICQNCLSFLDSKLIPLPIIDFCIQLCKKIYLKKISNLEFKAELLKLKVHQKRCRKEFNKIQINHQSAEPLKYAKSLAREGLKLFEEGLKLLENFLIERKKNFLKEGLEILVSSAKKFIYLDVLVDYAKDFFEFSKTKNIKINLNEELNNFPQSSKFVELKEKAYLMLDRELSVEEFFKFHKNLKENILKAYLQLKNTKLPSKVKDENYILLEEGLKLYLEGLNIIEDYKNIQDSNYIFEGLKLAFLTNFLSFF
ncbi:MAG: hypothetical protein HYU63_03325 [Armatimonadetes bacterium]|nr:hypothetical protein [Armatimonadota bacterium]